MLVQTAVALAGPSCSLFFEGGLRLANASRVQIRNCCMYAHHLSSHSAVHLHVLRASYGSTSPLLRRTCYHPHASCCMQKHRPSGRQRHTSIRFGAHMVTQICARSSRLQCRCRAKREYLHGKLEEVEGKLREARGQRRETDKDKQASEAAAQLKRSVAGQCHPQQCLYRIDIARLPNGTRAVHCQGIAAAAASSQPAASYKLIVQWTADEEQGNGRIMFLIFCRLSCIWFKNGLHAQDDAADDVEEHMIGPPWLISPMSSMIRNAASCRHCAVRQSRG